METISLFKNKLIVSIFVLFRCRGSSKYAFLPKSNQLYNGRSLRHENKRIARRRRYKLNRFAFGVTRWNMYPGCQRVFFLLLAARIERLRVTITRSRETTDVKCVYSNFNVCIYFTDLFSWPIF